MLAAWHGLNVFWSSPHAPPQQQHDSLCNRNAWNAHPRLLTRTRHTLAHQHRFRCAHYGMSVTHLIGLLLFTHAVVHCVNSEWRMAHTRQSENEMIEANIEFPFSSLSLSPSGSALRCVECWMHNYNCTLRSRDRDVVRWKIESVAHTACAYNLACANISYVV